MNFAMQLYEEVCDAEGCTERGCSATTNATSAPPTILLLPPQFSVMNESRLPDLVRIYASIFYKILARSKLSEYCSGLG